jgi:UDP-N-acetylmuramyl pentapeptide phosphotransferase/UDP-N-acetylglucosamine-1-phosphate transferase
MTLTGDCPLSDGHKTHGEMVPRVGGIAVFFGGAAGLAVASGYMYPEWARILWTVWVSQSLIFAVGLAEDLTRRVSVAVRFGAVFLAVFLVSVALGRLAISSVAIPALDPLLAMPLVGTFFFAFCVAGLVHAFNLIDGQNGLCSGYSTMSFLALGVAAAISGHAELGGLALILAVANLGFLAFNFPGGRIFLGDSGAYFNGAVAAVLCVLFVEYTLDVSPWFAVLLFIYPVWEAFFTILRRCARRQRFYKADRDHLHHRMHDLLVRHLPGCERFAALPVLLVGAPAPVLAICLLDSHAALAAISAGMFLIFSGLYLCLGILRDRATAGIERYIEVPSAESSGDISQLAARRN